MFRRTYNATASASFPSFRWSSYYHRVRKIGRLKQHRDPPRLTPRAHQAAIEALVKVKNVAIAIIATVKATGTAHKLIADSGPPVQ
jgi:hypothetical protein